MVESAANPVIFGQTWQVKDGPLLLSSLPGSAASACSRSRESVIFGGQYFREVGGTVEAPPLDLLTMESGPRKARRFQSFLLCCVSSRRGRHDQQGARLVIVPRLGAGGRFLIKPVPNQVMQPRTDGRREEEPNSHAMPVP